MKNTVKHVLQPEDFEQEMLNTDLKQLSRDEEAHLEKEFENYDRLYPRQ